MVTADQPENALDKSPYRSMAKDFVDTGSKVAFFAATIAYILGVLVVNLNLARYGFVNFGLLKVEYAIAGSVWLALVLFSGTGLYWTWIEVRETWASSTVARKCWKVLLFLLAAYTFPTYSIGYFGEYSLPSWDDCRRALALWLNISAIYFLFTWIKAIVDALNDRASLSRHIGRILYNAVFSIFFLVLAVNMYAKYIFPYITPSYAGGKHRNVTIVVKDDQIDFLKSMNFGYVGKRTFCGIVLIAESSDSVILRTPAVNSDGRFGAIQLNKSSIDAIRVDK